MNQRVNGWIVIVGLVWASCAANAAERVKANNITNLNVGASWVGSAVPGANDYGKWNNTVTGPNAVLLGGNMSVQGLMIANPSGEVAIGGGHTLTTGFVGFNLNTATVDLTVTNQCVALLDYTTPLWIVPAGRTLTVRPALVSRGAGAALGVVGAGTVSSATLTNDATGLIGPWAWYGAGASAKYATVSGGSVTGYTGAAAATAAGVADTTGAVNYDVAAVGTLGAGAAFNTLRYTGAGGTIAGNFSANGLLNSGSGALTFSGNATVGASKELVFNSPDGTRTLTLSGSVSDGAGGASGVTLTGGGKLSLTGNNTYSGVTVVSAGTLYINKSDALGSTNGNTVIYVSGSSVTGGMIQVAGNITIAEPLTFVGSGDGAPWNSALSVPGGGGTNTLAGPITIAMSTSVRLTASGAGTALNINGPVVRTGGGSTLILGAGGTNGMVVVNYPINNNGGSVNTHNGPGGLVRLNAAGNNFGALNVQTYQTVQLGVSDALVPGCSLSVGGSSITSGDQAAGVFDMNGFNQTINSFSGDGVPAMGPNNRLVTNSAPALSVLTIGSSNGGGTFNGYMDGNIALIKNGTGVQTNRGPNRYTGGTTVNGGTLVLSNTVNHGSLTVNGGTFLFPPALTVNGTLSGTGGTIDTGSAGTVLTVNQSTNTTFAGALTNAGALVKSGVGTLTLSGANTYSGGTTVSQGTLIFGKTASKPAAGSVTVSAGANLGLGLGGAGGFTVADIDLLWSGAMPGVTLDATSRIGIDTSAGDATYATSQPAHGLVKTGTNTLTLTGANTYSGGTFVQAGVLSIPSTTALPGWNTGGSYWVSRDAGLAVGSAVSDTEFATITGTGNFADGGFVGFDTTLSNRTYTVSISNTVNGALGLVKVGTNTLTLTSGSTYDGNTLINGGMVVIKNSTALGSTNGCTVINRIGGTAPNYTDANGQLRLDGSAGALTLNENFYITGDQQYSYGGALRSIAGNNVINGWIVVGSSGRIGVDGGNLTLNGRILRANSTYNPMLVLNPGTGYLIVSNTIDIGSTGLLNCHSAGTVIFCATNCTWGSSQIQYGGIARLGVDEGMSYGKRVTMGHNDSGNVGNGWLDLYGYKQTIGGLLEFGNAASKLNNIITNGRPSSASTLTVSQSAGVSDVFGGRLTGALNLVKTGAANSVLTLWGTNTLTGTVTVDGGSLVLSATGTLGANITNVVLAGTGTLTLSNSVAIADAATVMMPKSDINTAKINLASGVNELVSRLIFGDKMQRTGTYGSSTSGAAVKDDTHFLGTGILTVLRDNSGTLLRLQ